MKGPPSSTPLVPWRVQMTGMFFLRTSASRVFSGAMLRCMELRLAHHFEAPTQRVIAVIAVDGRSDLDHVVQEPGTLVAVKDAQRAFELPRGEVGSDDLDLGDVARASAMRCGTLPQERAG